MIRQKDLIHADLREVEGLHLVGTRGLQANHILVGYQPEVEEAL